MEWSLRLEYMQHRNMLIRLLDFVSYKVWPTVGPTSTSVVLKIFSRLFMIIPTLYPNAAIFMECIQRAASVNGMNEMPFVNNDNCNCLRRPTILTRTWSSIVNTYCHIPVCYERTPTQIAKFSGASSVWHTLNKIYLNQILQPLPPSPMNKFHIWCRRCNKYTL